MHFSNQDRQWGGLVPTVFPSLPVLDVKFHDRLLHFVIVKALPEMWFVTMAGRGAGW